MRVRILYGSRVKAGKRSRVSVCEDRATPYFVRSEIVQAESLTDALDKAKPKLDETVLNTVPV